MRVLNVENLVKIYGGKNESSSTYAVNGINLSVEKGEFVGIMGPSGSGKTTLLNLLSGIDTATTGKIMINEQELNHLSEHDLSLFRRQHIGFVFQDFNLLDSLTVKENIMLPMILDKRSETEMTKKSEELMTFFDIHESGNKYPYQLSGGQKQRTAACRALMNAPSIVFADEPTGNLDSKSSNSMMETLALMNENKQATILMVTHDPFAASFCKRILFIKDGKVTMDLMRKGSRQAFFDKILDCEAVIGGDRR